MNSKDSRRYAMNKCVVSPSSLIAGALVAGLALLAMAACDGDNGPPLTAPDAVRSGEEIFNTNCSSCHGVGATGTDAGPPLVHRIYEPGHHPDFSIRNAVNQGVTQHHWFFGNMPPVAGLSADDVEKVICYIREAQRDGGIFEANEYGGPC